MAKTVKKESKPKTINKNNTITKETNSIENTISSINEDDNDEPILVNDKNEIIYDPQEELKKVMEKIEPNIPTDFLENDVKEGIEFLKKNATLPTDLGSDVDKSLEYVEKQMEELNKVKENIMKNYSNKNSNFNFTSYWNGTTNKW
jgi:hypothetical protein